MNVKNLIVALILVTVPSVAFSHWFIGVGIADFNGMNEMEHYLYRENMLSGEVGYRHKLRNNAGVQASVLMYPGINGIGFGGGGFVRVYDNVILSAGYEVFNGRSNYFIMNSEESYAFTDNSQWSAPYVRLDAMFSNQAGLYIKLSTYNVDHNLSLTVCDNDDHYCNTSNIPLEDTSINVLNIGVVTQF